MKVCSTFLIVSAAIFVAACGGQPAKPVETSIVSPSENSQCIHALTGTFSSRGTDHSGGQAVFYYEITALPRANAAASLKVSIDAAENRLVLRQLSVTGSDVVAPSRIRGRCEGGAWVNAFDGESSAEGRYVRVSGQVSFAVRGGNLVVSYLRRQESRMGVATHDRVGVFPHVQ